MELEERWKEGKMDNAASLQFEASNTEKRKRTKPRKNSSKRRRTEEEGDKDKKDEAIRDNEMTTAEEREDQHKQKQGEVIREIDRHNPFATAADVHKEVLTEEEEVKLKGGTLIICPLSVLNQWSKEIVKVNCSTEEWYSGILIVICVQACEEGSCKDIHISRT